MLRGESKEGKQNVLEFRSVIWEERSLSLMLSFITIFFFFGISKEGKGGNLIDLRFIRKESLQYTSISSHLHFF